MIIEKITNRDGWVIYEDKPNHSVQAFSSKQGAELENVLK